MLSVTVQNNEVSYKEYVENLRSIDFKEFKKPSAENKSQENLLKNLEYSNIFSDCFIVFEDLQKELVSQDEYKEAIRQHYINKLDLKEDTTHKQAIYNFLREARLDFYVYDLNESFEFIYAFYKHRVLFRNLKGYFMQILFKKAILESAHLFEHVAKSMLVESKHLDFGFAVDFALKMLMKHKEGSETKNTQVSVFLHITKESKYAEYSVKKKLSKDYIYKYTKENGKVEFYRYYSNENIVLTYVDDYRTENVEVLEINEFWNVPAESSFLIKKLIDFVNDLKKLGACDVQYTHKDLQRNRKTRFYMILETLNKLDNEKVFVSYA